MKRFISMLVLTALLSMGMITTAFAAGASISVSSVDAARGETVTVSVKLNGNTGFNNYLMTLNYDTDALELTDISGAYVTAANTANGMVNFATASAVSDDEVILFTASFKVKEEAGEGTHAVGVTVTRIGTLLNGEFSGMNPSVNSGSVNVTVAHVCEPVDVAGTDATCETDGVKAHQKCACGKYYIDGKEVSAEDIVLKASGHTWEWVVDKAATTEETGLKHEECSVCGEKRNEGTVIDKIPTEPDDDHEHVYGDWKSDDKNHWKECACGDIVTEAHKLEWIVDKKATADTEGQKHEECSVCGYKNAAVKIPATGAELDDVPQTGDLAVNQIMLAVTAIVLAGAAVILVQRKRRSTK